MEKERCYSIESMILKEEKDYYVDRLCLEENKKIEDKTIIWNGYLGKKMVRLFEG